MKIQFCITDSRWIAVVTGALLVCWLAFPTMSLGITLGQIDTFEDGTKQGWAAGPTLQIQPGGPAGPIDHYLRIIPSGSGPSVLMNVGNFTQWSGNYVSAGVTSVEMDLINFDASNALQMRVSISDMQNPLANFMYGSTTAFSLPGDGKWHHISFSITANSMTGGSNASPFATVIRNVGGLSVFNSIGPTFIAPGLSQFGIDNIHAIPEPASIRILLSGIIGVAFLGRRRATRLK